MDGFKTWVPFIPAIHVESQCLLDNVNNYSLDLDFTLKDIDALKGLQNGTSISFVVNEMPSDISILCRYSLESSLTFL